MVAAHTVRPSFSPAGTFSMAHCLVTGGAGFIGSHLVETLLARGDSVTVLDNLSTGRGDNLSHLSQQPRLQIVTGSITDQPLLSEVVREAEVIYHLAAAVGVRLVADDPVRTIETNIYPTELLLRLAAQRNCRFFLASTSEVYGKNPKERWNEDDDLQFGSTTHPRWAYGCSKAIDEFLALAYHTKFGLPVVIGRFFNVVGPRQVGHYGMVVPRFLDAALAGDPLFVYDDGGQTRCFAHVREVVDCVVGLTALPSACGRVYNIGSDHPITIRGLAEEVLRLTGSRSPIEYRAYAEAYGRDFEDVRRRVPNLERLEATLGRKPRLTLPEILSDILKWRRGEARPGT